MSLLITTVPLQEPLTYEEVLDHLRVSLFDGDFDLYLETKVKSLITAVRKNVEDIYGRALITQTWYYFLNNFPKENFIEIPLPPLQSITSIKYTDWAGDEYTFDPSNYIVDIVSEPGKVVLTYVNTWPTYTPLPVNSVKIEFVCGYGDNAENVPEPITNAMLMAIADLWENRQTITERPVNKIDVAANLLAPYRIWSF